MNESLLKILPPRPPGYGRDRESFASGTGITFDPLAAAESAIQITMNVLLNPERLARIHQYHSRDPENPALTEIMQTLFRHIFKAEQEDNYNGDLQRLAQTIYANYLIGLDANSNTTSYVKAEIYNQLINLLDWLEDNASNESWEKHNNYLRDVIKSYLKNPSGFQKKDPVYIPPGSPIGSKRELFMECSY
jgi:hypothetical protein